MTELQLTSQKSHLGGINMRQNKELRPEGLKRPADLDTLRHFWDFMSRHFGDIPVDLSLFNFKGKKVSVRHGVGKDIPMGQVYETVLKLLERWYDKGEDILWRPAYSMPDDFLVSLLWVDDFNPDNELGLKPLLYIQTSPPNANKPAKYQAFFKLTEPVPLALAKELQKGLARALGDKAAGSYVQPRRMAGLANGKYPDDPLVIMFLGEEGDGILSPEDIEKISPIPIKPARAGVAVPTSGTIDIPEEDMEDLPEERLIFKPIVNIGKPYKILYIKKREAFIKIKDGRVDESATDMAWATYIARKALSAGWDEGMLAFTLMDYLKTYSPELERRKKTVEHARDYAIRTVLKAIDIVKSTPLDRDRNRDTGIDDLIDMF
jgi:hypothetical protein